MNSSIKKEYVTPVSISITLAIGIFIFFLPLLQAGFLNWDDSIYITDNEFIQAFRPENIKAIFTQSFLSTYLPVTMLSYMIDFAIGGLNPKIFHLTNILLHIGNSLLVFFLATVILNRRGAQNRPARVSSIRKLIAPVFVALLFALNPLQIESVAWLAERKNVLSAFFFLMSMTFYLQYLKQNNLKYYFFTLIAFLVSCLSKGTAVSFSLTLLCLDYISDRKLFSKRILIEKIPFFLLSAVFGILAIAEQSKSAALHVGATYSFFNALLYGAYGFSMYFFHLLLPVNISAYYPYPHTITPVLWVTLIGSLLLVSSIVYCIRKQEKVFAFGLLFFLVNIVFLLQVLPVGMTIMADRYVYLSSIGLFLIIGHACQDGFKRINNNLLLTACIGYLFFIAIAGFLRERTWNDSIALWDDVIHTSPEVPIAWNNRGLAKEETGDIQGAILDYEYYVRHFPPSEYIYSKLGNCRYHTGDFQGALADLNTALRLRPQYYVALATRGKVYSEMKEYQRAMEDFENALKSEKHYSVYYNRAVARYDMKDYQGAIEDFEEVLKQKPELIDFPLPDSYFNLGNFKKAIEYYVSLTRIHPGAENYRRLAFTYFSAGDYVKAVEAYDSAIQLQPQNPDIYTNRGCTKMAMNDYRGSINDFTIALTINSNDVKALFNRGIAKCNVGMKTEGCSDLRIVAAMGYPWASEAMNKNCR